MKKLLIVALCLSITAGMASANYTTADRLRKSGWVGGPGTTTPEGFKNKPANSSPTKTGQDYSGVLSPDSSKEKAAPDVMPGQNGHGIQKPVDTIQKPKWRLW